MSEESEFWYPVMTPTFWRVRNVLWQRISENYYYYHHRLCFLSRSCAKMHDCNAE